MVDVQLRFPRQEGQTPALAAEDYGDLQPWSPPAAPVGAAPAAEDYGDLQPWTPTAPGPPDKQVSGSEAFGRGVAGALTFGTGPLFEGLASAAGPEWNQSQAGHDIAPVVGAAKMIGDYLSSHPDPEVQKSFREGREAAQRDQDLAAKQHPWAYGAGQLTGAVAIPVPGLGPASGLGRVGAGIATGGVLGGAQSAGESFSRGETPTEVAQNALTGGAIGAVTGGALHGALGPRLPRSAATSAGQRAAETAADLGGSIPTFAASDNRGIQGAGAVLESTPFLGTRGRRQIEDVAQKAGARIKDIAKGKAGGLPERATADVIARQGLQDVVDKNMTTIRGNYAGMRSQINQTQRYTMPRLERVLDAVAARRARAGKSNPELGLDQFRNVSRGADLEGARDARYAARTAGSGREPHPGYDKKQYDLIEKAMTADMREMVQAAAKNQTMAGRAAALQAFDDADKQFGPLADQNRMLNKLIHAPSEAAISRILGSAYEEGGNLPLLRQLKTKMPAADFEHVGGLLLHELGGGKDFSLKRFANSWDDLSKGAKDVLFSPTHLKQVEDIVSMTDHLGRSLKDVNTSKTSTPLMLFDLAKDAILGVAAMGSGAGLGAMLGPGALAGGAAGTAGLLFTHWLMSPAKTAAINAWGRAYRGVTLGVPTPARQAVFKIATRNLAHNLGIPLEQITSRLTQAQPQTQNPQPTPPRVINQ